MNVQLDMGFSVRQVEVRLHAGHAAGDPQGNRVTTIIGPLKVGFHMEDLGAAFPRAVLVAFPAFFAATAVDFMN